MDGQCKSCRKRTEWIRRPPRKDVQMAYVRTSGRHEEKYHMPFVNLYIDLNKLLCVVLPQWREQVPGGHLKQSQQLFPVLYNVCDGIHTWIHLRLEAVPRHYCRQPSSHHFRHLHDLREYSGSVRETKSASSFVSKLMCASVCFSYILCDYNWN